MCVEFRTAVINSRADNPRDGCVQHCTHSSLVPYLVSYSNQLGWLFPNNTLLYYTRILRIIVTCGRHHGVWFSTAGAVFFLFFPLPSARAECVVGVSVFTTSSLYSKHQHSTSIIYRSMKLYGVTRNDFLLHVGRPHWPEFGSGSGVGWFQHWTRTNFFPLKDVSIFSYFCEYSLRFEV